MRTPRRAKAFDVALVEATDKFGGTTAYSGGGGMWFPCNPVLQRAGADDTIDDALDYYTPSSAIAHRASCRKPTCAAARR